VNSKRDKWVRSWKKYIFKKWEERLRIEKNDEWQPFSTIHFECVCAFTKLFRIIFFSPSNPFQQPLLCWANTLFLYLNLEYVTLLRISGKNKFPIFLCFEFLSIFYNNQNKSKKKITLKKNILSIFIQFHVLQLVKT
jgi:hypothetical protein